MAKVWLLLLAVALVVQVEGRFAASDGFSGRDGGDCSVCHQPVAVATPHIDGLPAHWQAGAVYPLSIRVTGGPPAAPEPQPQGGFELATDTGSLHAGDGMEGLLRNAGPDAITYEPEGTLMREWRVEWRPSGPPLEATLWLAVVAANGNHVIATNQSDGGETGDATGAMVVTVAPDPAAAEAWAARALGPPEIDRVLAREGGWRIEGRHTDPAATHLGFDTGSGWSSQATATTWSIRVDGSLDALRIRSEGEGRVSPIVAPTPQQEAPGAIWLVPLGLGAAIFVQRRHL